VLPVRAGVGTADGGLRGARGRFWGIDPSIFKNNFLPFQPLVTFPGKILSSPSFSPPYSAPSLPFGNVYRSRSKAGRDRRLRFLVDETREPGSPYPKVPRRYYGRLCRTVHCSSLGQTLRRSNAGVSEEGSGTGCGLVKNAGQGVWRCHMLNYRRQDHTPCFPGLFNDQTGNGAWWRAAAFGNGTALQTTGRFTPSTNPDFSFALPGLNDIDARLSARPDVRAWRNW
jgi:hypothetical protein